MEDVEGERGVGQNWQAGQKQLNLIMTSVLGAQTYHSSKFAAF